MALLKRYNTYTIPWSTPAAGTQHIFEIMPKGQERIVWQITAVMYTGALTGWYSTASTSAGPADNRISFFGNRTAFTANEPVLLRTDSNPLYLRSDRYLNMTVTHAAGVATTGRVWVTYSEV